MLNFFDIHFSSSAHTTLNLTKGSETRLTNDLADIRGKASKLREEITNLTETLSSKHILCVTKNLNDHQISTLYLNF